jgi:hypothetical protein
VKEQYKVVVAERREERVNGGENHAARRRWRGASAATGERPRQAERAAGLLLRKRITPRCWAGGCSKLYSVLRMYKHIHAELRAWQPC